MVDEYLKITDCPRMTNATMLVALTGWMDGGHVSTGTVKRLMDQRSAPKVAEIEPDLFSMRWSPEYQVPKDLADARSILVNPERFHPFFESAAKSLRPAGVLPEEQVRGAVIALRAPDAGQAPGGGDVTLRPAGGDQRTNYHVILTGTDYRAACDAHRDGIDIVVTGRPERVGRNWRLAGARDFRAASASPKQLEGDAKD